MPPQPSLADLLDPLIAAVVTEECPGGAVALDSTLPAVATEAQRGGDPERRQVSCGCTCRRCDRRPLLSQPPT